MVKTIRGKVDFEVLKGRLMEHIRKLPDYTKVVSDNFCFDLSYNGMRIELGDRGVSAYILPKQYPKGEKLAIQVNTEGKDMEKWKPDVDKIKAFIEGLVGEPCIVVPMSKKERLASQPPLEEALQATLEQVKNKGGV